MQSSDVLNEIYTVSAMQATSALSKLIEKPVQIRLKPIKKDNIKELSLDDSNEKTENFFLPITGNLHGASIFQYTKQAALALCDLLFHRKEGTTKNLDEPEISALAEVSNIVIGNFLTAFANSMQMDYLMHRSVTYDRELFVNTLSKMLPTMDHEMSEQIVNISFGFQHINIRGNVYVIFEENKLNPLLKKIILISG